ncbi:MAG: amidase domain-containing protein [Clostridia bacterium]|nr:amidase domain-containing protein [Clostridia bacterium]
MLIDIPYDPARAVEYAKAWALQRNPLFPDFAGIGGDCTNFVSQCLLAGGATMNDTRDFGWYYFSPENRAPAWSGVEYLYNFLTGDPEYLRENGGEGPYAREVTFAEGVREGDVVQLADTTGDYYHTLIITGFDGQIPLVCAHNDDAYMRPLSTYRFGTARFLRPMGTRLYADTTAAYRELLQGMAYRPPMLTTAEILLGRGQAPTM